MKAIVKSNILKVLLVNVLVEKGFNVREDFGDIDALAKSIAKIGQSKPLKGRRSGDNVVLTGGHRRLAAIHLANKKYIGKKGFLQEKIERASIITDTGSEQKRVVEMLLDGEGAKTLTNEEMVRGIKRLLDGGMNKKDIIDSLAIGHSQAQKYNLLKAAQAPKAIQDMLDNGLISVAVVNKLQREAKGDEVKLIDLANEAVDDAKAKGEKKATGSNTKAKASSDVAKLEAAIELADPTSAKAATLKAIVNKLKAKASAEDIAKLLK